MGDDITARMARVSSVMDATRAVVELERGIARLPSWDRELRDIFREHLAAVEASAARYPHLADRVARVRAKFLGKYAR